MSTGNFYFSGADSDAHGADSELNDDDFYFSGGDTDTHGADRDSNGKDSDSE